MNNDRNFKIVCLCGSMKYYQPMIKIAEILTSQEYIIIMPFVTNATGEKKEMLDLMHKQKIRMSDVILIVDIDNYVGESTKNEIEYATQLNKPVFYFSKKDFSTDI